LSCTSNWFFKVFQLASQPASQPASYPGQTASQAASHPDSQSVSQSLTHLSVTQSLSQKASWLASQLASWSARQSASFSRLVGRVAFISEWTYIYSLICLVSSHSFLKCCIYCSASSGENILQGDGHTCHHYRACISSELNRRHWHCQWSTDTYLFAVAANPEMQNGGLSGSVLNEGETSVFGDFTELLVMAIL
jgi:hypothetical protein